MSHRIDLSSSCPQYSRFPRRIPTHYATSFFAECDYFFADCDISEPKRGKNMIAGPSSGPSTYASRCPQGRSAYVVCWDCLKTSVLTNRPLVRYVPLRFWPSESVYQRTPLRRWDRGCPDGTDAGGMSSNLTQS